MTTNFGDKMLLDARIEYLEQQIQMHEGFITLFDAELTRARAQKEELLSGGKNVQR